MVTVRRGDARAGYVLLATLWICVGVGALTWLISLSAREAIGAARNRIALTTAAERSQACLVYAREAVRDALMRANDPTVWDHVDRILAAYRVPVAGCTISARPVGARLDVNATDEATLSRVFQAAGWRASRADSAAAAIADWTSKSPFVDVRELRRVRGLENWDRLDSLFDVAPGPLAINQAPAVLLSILPGFTERTVREVLDARSQSGITSFLQMRPWLDPAQPETSARLPGLVVLNAPAWIVAARTRTGFPAVTVVTEVRLGRAALTTAVVFRRSWIE